MKQSPFFKFEKTFYKRQHKYKRGNQFELTKPYMLANANSFVLFLQTEAASKRY